MQPIPSARRTQLLKARQVVLDRINLLAEPVWREYFEGLSADEIKAMVDETDVDGNLLVPKDSIGFRAAKDIFGSKTHSTDVTYTPVAARIDAEASATAGLESYNSRTRG